MKFAERGEVDMRLINILRHNVREADQVGKHDGDFIKRVGDRLLPRFPNLLPNMLKRKLTTSKKKSWSKWLHP